MIAKEAIAANQEVVKAGVYELRNRLAPLHCAAAHGHAEALQALIDAGAPLEATDGFGNTALQVLTTRNCMPMCSDECAVAAF